MVVIVSKNKNFIDALSQELAKYKSHCKVLDPDQSDLLTHLYLPTVSAIVLDQKPKTFPQSAAADLANSLAHRIPVVVLRPEEQVIETKESHRSRAEYSDTVTVINKHDPQAIAATLDACGVLGTLNPKLWKRSVAYYSPHVPTKLLVENGSLGILTIDASSFRKIEVEYGSEIYSKVKDLFQNLLNEMWGRPGCFRSTDVLCRRSDHGNLFYVFLNRSRMTGSLPLPGVLEHISDRLARIIQNSIRAELTAPAKKRRLPQCIQSMPKIVVGYGSAINNPCLDPHEIIATAMDDSAKFASIQSVRNLDRQREMMLTLIQSPELLYPKFQAVFRLGGITKDMLDLSVKEKSISPLQPFLYAFESLIRVRSDEVRALMGSGRAAIDPSYLTPDVLFETAKSTKVALELDQACLNLAILHGKSLPGYLMVNILPRNLYFMKHLENLFKVRGDIILEVSESEAINNVEFFEEIRQQLSGRNIRIAADDFGRAFAGLDRVIQMKPHLIKFDRGLIQDIHEDPVKHAYVSGLVEAARLLKTEVLAEGVEKWEELEVLQKMNIDFIQGFLLHKPQDLESIIKQLSEKSDIIDLPTVA